jgi:hypothetical protein
MIKGHLDQSRSNARSTKPKLVSFSPANQNPPTATTTDESSSPADPSSLRTHHIYASYQPITGQIFSDPTGRFILPSSTGNKGMLLLYDHDSNYIHVEPLKNHQSSEMLAAYKRGHALFTQRGLKPQLQKLDNEASAMLQQFMTSENIDFQLVPPHVHRRNAAERAIRTFKNHFIAGLCSTDKDFPLHLWDRLLPQALISLNLLRGSRINPRLSAYAQLHGAFDYNRTPLAPPGTRVLVHEKPAVRGTWAAHAVDGWHLGPALNHYRCHRVWIWATRAERISDTLSWFPSKVSMPTASPVDRIQASVLDLLEALSHPIPNAPMSLLSPTEHAELLRIATLFGKDLLPTPAVPPGFAPLHTPTEPDPTDPTPVPRVPDTSSASVPRVPTSSPAPVPRVPTASLASIPKSPASSPAPVPRVPLASPATYRHLTRNAGQRRRQQKARATAAKAITPNSSPRPLPTHPPNTRSRRRKRPTTRSSGLAATCHSANQASTFLQHALPATNFSLFPAAHSANSVIDPVTGASLEYKDLKAGPDSAEWIQSTANEIGRLTQGTLPDMKSGTETMFFIPHTAVPAGRKATYLRIVAKIRPEKKENKRIRFTVGGDRIDYPGKVSTPTADITTAKCLLNSVVSTPDAKFMTIDLANFYLNTPMERFEYMRIPLSAIPDCIMDQYNLKPLIHNGSVMVEIRKGMYGLPQAGILANNRLVKHLATFGYSPAKHTPGIFHHATRPISFCLVVDDFGVKYVGRENAEHLVSALESLYDITTEWQSSISCLYLPTLEAAEVLEIMKQLMDFLVEHMFESSPDEESINALQQKLGSLTTRLKAIHALLAAQFCTESNHHKDERHDLRQPGCWTVS